MANNKLAIIGGSGLYDVEEFKERELLDLNTPWGKPSDQILKTNYNNNNIPIESNLLLTTKSSNKKGMMINIPPIVGVLFFLK